MTDESWLVLELLRGELTRGLINSPGLFDPLLLSHEQTCSHSRGVRDLAYTRLRIPTKRLYNNTITAHQQDMDQTASDMHDEPTE
jgi:hypothetical protein